MATVNTDTPLDSQLDADDAPETGERRRGSRGRGRGRGRDRGSGRGRSPGSRRGVRGRTLGAASYSRILEDPSKGWHIRTPAAHAVMLDREFSRDVIAERARLFCSSAMSQLRIERIALELPATRAGHIILLMDDVLQQCRKWMNGHIALHARDTRPVGLDDLYRYVAVLLLSHLTGLSFEKTVSLLARLDCKPPSLDRVRYISRNILAHPATGRGNMGERTWSAQRDETQYLDSFEKAAYEMTRKVFLTPMHTFATLDDDLYGTRASDNQVKTLSMRKADREGHTADVIADALFRITLAVRFRRRGEQQSANVLRLISTLIEGRGEQCLHGLVLTADRGYGSIALIRTLLRHGIGSILVMP
jgi:hypothetical protein